MPYIVQHPRSLLGKDFFQFSSIPKENMEENLYDLGLGKKDSLDIPKA